MSESARRWARASLIVKVEAALTHSRGVWRLLRQGAPRALGERALDLGDAATVADASDAALEELHAVACQGACVVGLRQYCFAVVIRGQ